MKRNGKAIIASLFGVLLCGVGAVEQKGVDEETINRVDNEYERALRENYRPEGLLLMKESLDACTKNLDANPACYDLLWRSARSAVELGEAAKILQTRDWKKLCGSMARKGIEWTDAAKRGFPDRVEGYFWQLKAMDLIYDAEGMLSFIAMGLVPKSRQNLSACYAIDRSYMDYTPVLATALYYYKIPPVFGQDIAKALVYYEEYASLSRWSFESYRQYPDAAEMLLSTKSEKNTERARTLLLAALADPTPRPFYLERTKTLLARLERSPH